MNENDEWDFLVSFRYIQVEFLKRVTIGYVGEITVSGGSVW